MTVLLLLIVIASLEAVMILARGDIEPRRIACPGAPSRSGMTSTRRRPTLLPTLN